jgi:hypothetical protein
VQAPSRLEEAITVHVASAPDRSARADPEYQICPGARRPSSAPAAANRSISTARPAGESAGTGATPTINVAVVPPPVPPLVELTPLVTMFFAPSQVGVTLNWTVHALLAATLPPESVTEPEPAAAVTVPPQVLLSPFGVAITRPAGKAAVNARPLSAVPALAFVMVKDNVVVAFTVSEAAPKAWLIAGGVK